MLNVKERKDSVQTCFSYFYGRFSARIAKRIDSLQYQGLLKQMSGRNSFPALY